jgi:hypothetical protein
LISFKGEFVIFAAKLKDDSYLLKERLLSHNGEFVSIKGWKNNGGNVVFNGRIVIEPLRIAALYVEMLLSVVCLFVVIKLKNAC